MYRYLLLIFAFSYFSCEQTFIPEVSTDPVDIVVEGYIEGGERPLPPYVILTRSLPFFRRLDTTGLNELFVHDAIIRVTDGTQTVELTEFCLSELSFEQRALASGLLGIDLTSVTIDLCIYTDPTLSMFGEIGKTYILEIEAENTILTSSTTIPIHIPLDSLRFFEPSGIPIDTLAELRAYISDPVDQENFYRYFTKVNNGIFESPFPSVVEDKLFNGTNLEFPMPKAEKEEETQLSTFGLFHVGDTASVRWISLDQAHYEFWNTLEFNAANQGPFSSYTRIQSNINGGLGIWGGFSASYYEMIVKK